VHEDGGWGVELGFNACACASLGIAGRWPANLKAPKLSLGTPSEAMVTRVSPCHFESRVEPDETFPLLAGGRTPSEASREGGRTPNADQALNKSKPNRVILSAAKALTGISACFGKQEETPVRFLTTFGMTGSNLTMDI
jgi:hypothetical protein